MGETSIALENYKREQEFRKTNGLEYSQEAIEKALNSKNASISKNQYGVELTEEEQEKLQKTID